MPPQYLAWSTHGSSDLRHHRIYELVVRQEPKQARMCGVGGKGQCHSEHFLLAVITDFSSLADRRPIDPPPIVQLRVIDPATKSGVNATASSSRTRRNSDDNSPPGSPGPRPYPEDALDSNYSQSFLQNPYYFMFASLARPDDDAELHWLKVHEFSMSKDYLFIYSPV